MTKKVKVSQEVADRLSKYDCYYIAEGGGRNISSCVEAFLANLTFRYFEERDLKVSDIALAYENDWEIERKYQKGDIVKWGDNYTEITIEENREGRLSLKNPSQNFNCGVYKNNIELVCKAENREDKP